MHQNRRSGALRSTLRATVTLLAALALPLALVSVTDRASSAVPGPDQTLGTVGAVPVDSRAGLLPSPGNPLAAHPWGVYLGPSDMAWEPWTRTSGWQRRLLDKIVLQPKAQWFGKWVPDNEIADRIHKLVANATGGDPDVMVQMAIFRMVPWEGNDRICNRLPTDQEVASYKRWITNAAEAIGSTYVALILQPDGPFALCAKNGSKLPSQMIRFAAQAFSANPNTSVYIDAGAADWNRSNPATALRILMPAGIRLVRGFAFNSTHYSSTQDEVEYGAAVSRALADKGILDKHFVVNTSSNGQPFAGYTYKGPNFDNAWVCKTKTQHRCVTLGIPPTTDVANAKWGLPVADRVKAAAYCDGFLWFGRPWLYNQASPFVMKRALQLARTTPWQ